MNHSGDAAEQIVRMGLEGMTVVAKISGSAAKELALLILTALKGKDKNLKLKGKARMMSMLKSGKALEIFSVKNSDLKTFMQGAKQYGIVYCVLRNRCNADGLCDIMVRADDAPRISRMIERLKLTTVERATVEHTDVPGRDENARDHEHHEPDAAAALDGAEINDVENLLDELMGADMEIAKPTPEVDEPVFFTETAAKDRQFEPFYESRKTSEKDAFDMQDITEQVASEPNAGIAEQRPAFDFDRFFDTHTRGEDISSEDKPESEKGASEKPSVKERIREIRAARKQEKAAPMQDERDSQAKPKANTSTVHQQPQGGKPKSNKPKARVK